MLYVFRFSLSSTFCRLCGSPFMWVRVLCMRFQSSLFWSLCVHQIIRNLFWYKSCPVNTSMCVYASHSYRRICLRPVHKHVGMYFLSPFLVRLPHPIIRSHYELRSIIVLILIRIFTFSNAVIIDIETHSQQKLWPTNLQRDRFNEVETEYKCLSASDQHKTPHSNNANADSKKQHKWPTSIRMKREKTFSSHSKRSMLANN